MGRPLSVAHQIVSLGSSSTVRAGGQHWAAVLRRLSCLSSSLLGGAGESWAAACPPWRGGEVSDGSDVLDVLDVVQK